MIARMARILRLDQSVYDEIEHHPRGIVHAAIIVMMVAIASAIGTVLGAATGTVEDSKLIYQAISAFLMPFAHWIVWSYLTYLLGTLVFDVRTTPWSMLRTLGYAESPQVLSILHFIPYAGIVLVTFGRLLSMRAGFLAVQNTLGLDRRKTLLTVLPTFLCAFLLLLILRAFLVNMEIRTSLFHP
jgi:uncharacterized membrane protein